MEDNHIHCQKATPIPCFYGYYLLDAEDTDVDLTLSFPDGTKSSVYCRKVVGESRLLEKMVRLGKKLLVTATKAAAGEIYTVISQLCDCALVTSDLSKEDTMGIATMWEQGKFRVLISTTSGLVGNENGECRHLVVVDYIYNLFNVVQSIGRLRPSQRVGGSVRIILSKRVKLQAYDETASLSIKKLESRAVIPLNSVVFKDVGTVRSIHDWAFNDVGCRLANLSRRFGFGSASEKCGVCDRCMKTILRFSFPVCHSKDVRVRAVCHQRLIYFFDWVTAFRTLGQIVILTFTVLVLDTMRMMEPPVGGYESDTGEKWKISSRPLGFGTSLEIPQMIQSLR